MIRPLSFLAACCLSMSVMAANLGEARLLVEQRRYAEAITLYDALLTERPADADLLIEAGRVNAWADRHDAAARLYQQTIATAPARRHDVLLPLAWQFAWAGRHAEAIPLFREAAQQLPAHRTEALHGWAESLAASRQLEAALEVYRQLPPDDVRARKAEARLLRWLHRHAEAEARYRAILNDHPRDQEARLGLARSLNLGGRHFAALDAYARATESDATLARDTRIERATALRWAGLEDVALATLGDASGADADVLRERLARETASGVRAEYEQAWDSDELEIQAVALGWQPHRGQGRTLDLSARNARIVQRARQVDGRQLLLKAGTRLGSAATGLFWPAFSVGLRDYDGWQTPAWKLQGKWLPADFWRVDVEAANDVVETVDALRNEVTLKLLAVSTDWRFAPGWSATLGGAVLRFDDGNQRNRLIGRVEHVLRSSQPRLLLGIEGMGFDDSRPEIARGYYNPERYRELKMIGRVEHEAAGWLLDARLALGQLWETPGDSNGLYAWEASAARDLAPRLRLRLHAGGSDSSALSRTGSGYTRNHAGASLIWSY